MSHIEAVNQDIINSSRPDNNNNPQRALSARQNIHDVILNDTPSKKSNATANAINTNSANNNNNNSNNSNSSSNNNNASSTATTTENNINSNTNNTLRGSSNANAVSSSSSVGANINMPPNRLDISSSMLVGSRPILLNTDNLQSPSSPAGDQVTDISAAEKDLLGSAAATPEGDSSSDVGSSGEKKFVCEECSHSFTRRHNLKSHLLIHSKLKPHICHICKSRFRRSHDLKRHSKLHTGEKPFQCETCGRTFARSDALVRHNNSQSGCDLSFRNHQPTGANEGNDDGGANQLIEPFSTANNSKTDAIREKIKELNSLLAAASPSASDSGDATMIDADTALNNGISSGSVPLNAQQLQQLRKQNYDSHPQWKLNQNQPLLQSQGQQQNLRNSAGANRNSNVFGSADLSQINAGNKSSPANNSNNMAQGSSISSVLNHPSSMFATKPRQAYDNSNCSVASNTREASANANANNSTPYQPFSQFTNQIRPLLSSSTVPPASMPFKKPSFSSTENADSLNNGSNANLAKGYNNGSNLALSSSSSVDVLSNSGRRSNSNGVFSPRSSSSSLASSLSSAPRVSIVTGRKVTQTTPVSVEQIFNDANSENVVENNGVGGNRVDVNSSSVASKENSSQAVQISKDDFNLVLQYIKNLESKINTLESRVSKSEENLNYFRHHIPVNQANQSTCGNANGNVEESATLGQKSNGTAFPDITLHLVDQLKTNQNSRNIL